ncbi:FtsX-like permease family protein [Herbaspirillum sp. SJZ107]|uniref:FtsX-like permease family protein n=1 Tax=Herbaspirillum sp. SJZ107 TaxID=2572881 RepID=UPI0011535468|nr:ABC transporter permease [Herbaspirillum sp. SJZ107]TQK05363.1 FtsX-like permease family protein [Herbaspirillum sp. SJZ107]
MTPARLALCTVRRGWLRAWAALSAIGAAACMLELGAGWLHALSLAACASAAHMALQTLARRRELATLRALGMSGPALVWMLELEALWITCGGALPGLALGAIAAWGSGRSVGPPHLLPGQAAPLPASGALLPLAALVALAAACLLAALVPAIRAARHEVAHGLALLPPHQDG